MDAIVLRNIRAEKSNAWVRYKRIQRLKATFRLLELCVFLIILSRFTVHLPSIFRISADYFQGLSVTAVNPLFVFLIGNAIVVLLFLKSREQSNNGDHSSNPINDFYEEKSDKKNKGEKKGGDAKNGEEKKSAAAAAAVEGGGGKDDCQTTIVLKTDLHCEGCAKKIKCSIRNYDGCCCVIRRWCYVIKRFCHVIRRWCFVIKRCRHVIRGSDPSQKHRLEEIQAGWNQ